MDKKAGPCTILKIIENLEEKPPKRNKTHDLSELLFFGLTGAWEHKEVFFCFVLFYFNTFTGFVSGFHISQNLCARTGGRFSFSVARDQMLVA